MTLSSDPTSGTFPNGSQVLKAIVSNADHGDAVYGEESATTHSQESTLLDNSLMVMEVAAVQQAQQSNEVLESLPSTIPKVNSQTSIEDHADFISSSVPENVGLSFSSTPGYLANRWNLVNSPFSTPSSSQIAPVATPPMSVFYLHLNLGY